MTPRLFTEAAWRAGEVLKLRRPRGRVRRNVEDILGVLWWCCESCLVLVVVVVGWTSANLGLLTHPEDFYRRTERMDCAYLGRH